MMRLYILLILILPITVYAQIEITEEEKSLMDSLYISETEDIKGPDKVLHAEPIFIDLIRDLGARKGEREWNVGMGMTDKNRFDEYTTLVEYEWAPINRLGLEVELPFSWYYPSSPEYRNTTIPASKLNGIKTAIQYSFYVSEKRSLSLAIGYINEVTLTSFNQYNKERIVNGNKYNPFFVAAKRWTDNLHTLLYTGPVIEKHINAPSQVTYQVNSNFHYMISGTRNFIGVEFNKSIDKNDFDMTIRPQMRLAISNNLMVGIVTGVPIKRELERFSTFIRLIYEPKHKA